MSYLHTFSIGDMVDVDAWAGGNPNEFTGAVVALNKEDGTIAVRDQDDDVWECEPQYVHLSEE